VRGASLIVIILIISYFTQPYIQKFKEYQSLDEDEKTLIRCKNFPKISYPVLKKSIRRK